MPARDIRLKYNRFKPPLRVFNGSFDTPGAAHFLRIEIHTDHVYYTEDIRPQFYDGSVEYAEQSMDSARAEGPRYDVDCLSAEDRADFLRILEREQ